MSVPIGVATAIYLEEYAHKERWCNRLIELNIQNLAAVPAIVYGILGLAFIVRGPLGIGRVLLAGATHPHARRPADRDHLVAGGDSRRAGLDRQGAFALGATKWQVVWQQVLPASIPGIATGSILALSRAVGETAPLLLVGALHVRRLRPDAPRAVHGAPGPDLQLDEAPGPRRSRRLRRPRASCCSSSC